MPWAASDFRISRPINEKGGEWSWRFVQIAARKLAPTKHFVINAGLILPSIGRNIREQRAQKMAHPMHLQPVQRNSQQGKGQCRQTQDGSVVMAVRQMGRAALG